MSVEWTKGTEDLLQKILEAGLYMFVRERDWDKNEMHAFVHGYSGDCKVLPTSGYQIPLWGTEVYTCSSGLSDVLIKILTGIQIWFPNSDFDDLGYALFHPYCFQIYINLSSLSIFFHVCEMWYFSVFLGFSWNPDFSLPPHLLWNQILINVTYKPNQLRGPMTSSYSWIFKRVSIIYSNLSLKRVSFFALRSFFFFFSFWKD